MTTKSNLTLLISDLHLEADRPDITRAFVNFLKITASQSEALYILGDFFNIWIGDDKVSNLTEEISSLLSQLAETGTRIYLMHGNRDFLIRDEFAAKCCATLIAEPYLLTLYGKQYLLLHGDSLCTKDTDYMQFRNMVRNPDWQQEFLAKSLRERQDFADKARAKSKHMISNKAEDIMDVTQEEVVKIMRKHDVITLIHGHTHRPAEHKLQLKGKLAKRIVLGDWDQQGWYLQISKTNVDLINFPYTDRETAS